MCSNCKMDPADVARFRQRQGAVEVSDFDDEIPYRHPKRRKKKARTRGCPGNDGGPHVYVWTTELGNDFIDRWLGARYYEQYGFAPYEYKRCAGCLKKIKMRATADYEKWRREWRKNRWLR